WTDIEAGWHHLFGDVARLPAPARKIVASSHSVYSFIAMPQDRWSENLHAAEPSIDLSCLQTEPPIGFNAHVSEYLLSQLTEKPAVAEAVRQILRSISQRGVG